MARAQPDRVRPEVLLRRDARANRHPRAHPLRARTAQAAGRAQRRRSRALSSGGFWPEEPGGAGYGLCRRASGSGSRELTGRRHRQRSRRHPRAPRHATSKLVMPTNITPILLPSRAPELNPVEGFFSTITRRKIRRGVFKSVADLEEAIKRYIRAHNKTSKPFQWSASPVSIFKKLAEIPEPNE